MRGLLSVVVLTGCAAGGDPGSGGEALPNPGYTPYAVHAEGDAGLTPVLPEGAGRDLMAYLRHDRVNLVYTRCPEDAVCAIAGATSDDGLVFSPETALLTDPRGLSAPYLEAGPAGDVLWVVVGDGAALGRAPAEGDDFGAVEVALEGGPFSAPSVVNGPAGRRLFFVREGHLYMAAAVGTGWDTPTAVLGPCDETDCWPEEGVEHAEVRLGVSATGRRFYRAAFVNAGGGEKAVGFAASEDGATWSAVPFNPTLVLGRGTTMGLSNLRVGDRYFLYFSRSHFSRGRVAPITGAAVNRAGAPSVVF